MAVIDARAQIVCNLGPVISGAISDSHIQSGGIIYTTGSLELSGLFSHAPGTRVKLAFAGNGRLAAAPRNNLVVLSCLANPLTRRTQVELGCQLTYAKNRGVGTVPWWVLLQVQGGLGAYRPPYTIGAGTYLNNLFNQAGFTTAFNPLGTVDQYILDEQNDLSSGFLGKAADILSTYGLFAYASGRGNEVIVRRLPVGGGPVGSSAVINADQIIDLRLTSGGEEPAVQAVGVAVKKKVTPQPEEVEQTPLVSNPGPQLQSTTTTPEVLSNAPQAVEKTNTWRKSSVKTRSPVRFYKDETYNFGIFCDEKVISQEIVAAPDNRITERVVQKISTLAKEATAVIQDFLDAGITQALRANPNASLASVVAVQQDQAKRNGQLKVDSFTMEVYTYEKIKQKVPPNVQVNPDDLYRYRLRRKTVYDFVSRSVVFSRMPARNHALFAQPYVPAVLDLANLVPKDLDAEDIGDFSLISEIRKRFNEESPAQITAIDGTTYGTQASLYTDRIIDRIEETEYKYSDKFVKEMKSTWVPIGQTQPGQYQLNKALKQARQRQAEDGTRYAIDAQKFIDMYQPLVLDDFNMVTRSVDDDKEQPPAYGDNIEVDKEIVYGQVAQSTGTDPQTSSKNYEVPAAPDDIPTANGEVEVSRAEEIATDYARTQNALALSHRYGAQLTLPLGVLPPDPLSAISLNVDGLTGVYISNGTSWAFDASSCLVSTDAGFLGVRT